MKHIFQNFKISIFSQIISINFNRRESIIIIANDEDYISLEYEVCSIHTQFYRNFNLLNVYYMVKWMLNKGAAFRKKNKKKKNRYELFFLYSLKMLHRILWKLYSYLQSS